MHAKVEAAYSSPPHGVSIAHNRTSPRASRTRAAETNLSGFPVLLLAFAHNMVFVYMIAPLKFV